jgi:hypothetical protein
MVIPFWNSPRLYHESMEAFLGINNMFLAIEGSDSQLFHSFLDIRTNRDLVRISPRNRTIRLSCHRAFISWVVRSLILGLLLLLLLCLRWRVGLLFDFLPLFGSLEFLLNRRKEPVECVPQASLEKLWGKLDIISKAGLHIQHSPLTVDKLALYGKLILKKKPPFPPARPRTMGLIKCARSL